MHEMPHNWNARSGLEARDGVLPVGVGFRYTAVLAQMLRPS